MCIPEVPNTVRKLRKIDEKPKIKGNASQKYREEMGL